MEFAKLQGSGNDFILIDNRDERFYEFLEKTGLCLKDFVVRVCERNRGVGADGLIIIENPEDPSNDFRWLFYNSDGSEAEMCGNGSRCAVRFCYEKGIVDEDVSFETLAGVIKAKVLESGKRVRVQLTKPSEPEKRVISVNGKQIEGVFINTGVPHFVVPVEDVNNIDVVSTGREIRFHDEFQPKGTNVNFISPSSENTIKIRTYERGVESETLACGTGATASAIVSHIMGITSGKPVMVHTRGGEILTIDFDDEFKNVFLEGRVVKVFDGILSLDMFKD